MNFRNDKFELELAQPRDLEQIRAIYEDGQFEGRIAVQYLRNPNPVASFEKEGEKVFFLVLRDRLQDRAVGFGICIIRKVYKDGSIVRLGYLSGLKLLPEYQKKVLYIPYIYQQLYELTKAEVDFYFTTILKDNTPVINMLEKPRKSMPLYSYMGDYRVYFCKAGIKHLARTGLAGYTARRCTKEELEAFFSAQAAKTDLALASVDAYDLANATFYGLFENSTLVGGGYVLNQQGYKQYVVKNYGGVYKLLSKLPTRLFGYPSFPAVNETANCACAGLWVQNDDIALAHRLWEFMRQDAELYDFLMIGLYEKHPLRAYFEKTRHIHYDSRCYIVDWEHNKALCEELQAKKLYIDVAFL